VKNLKVLITTKNEEDNLPACLTSAAFASEIWVVDSFSTDRTIEIAREYTDRVVEHPYVNSATQKNWAIPQATHEWVLVVDADERVTPELRQAILEVLERDGGGYDGFSIPRRNYFFGKQIRHCGWETDRVIRLFRRDRSRYQDRAVHADIVLDGKLGRLDAPFEHYTYRTMDQYFEKFHRYTRWAAQDLQRHGKRPSWRNLFLRPMFRFFKMFVIRRGFLDGKHGLVLCTLAAMSVFTKYARLWAREYEPAPLDSEP